MILKPDELDEGARRLVRASLNENFDNYDKEKKDAFRKLVADLAAALRSQRTEIGVKVFLAWMGDP